MGLKSAQWPLKTCGAGRSRSVTSPWAFWTAAEGSAPEPGTFILDLESTGFQAESTGFEIRIHWFPTSNPVDSHQNLSLRNQNPVDLRSESNGFRPETSGFDFGIQWILASITMLLGKNEWIRSWK